MNSHPEFHLLEQHPELLDRVEQATGAPEPPTNEDTAPATKEGENTPESQLPSSAGSDNPTVAGGVELGSAAAERSSEDLFSKDSESKAGQGSTETQNQ